MDKTLSELQNHWLWNDKPFAKGQAWIDLLFLSINTPTQTIYRNRIYLLEPGQIMVSENELCDRWGWSRTKLRSFLLLIEKVQMVIIVRGNGKTLITIRNHSTMQISIQVKSSSEIHSSIQDSIQDLEPQKIQVEKHLDTLLNKAIEINAEQEKKPIIKHEKESKFITINATREKHENTLTVASPKTTISEPYQLSFLDEIENTQLNGKN